MNKTVSSTGLSRVFGHRAVAHVRRAAVAPGSYAGGFSLVEIMVALVIGMLGMIVMMQMFSVFEGQKRTTTGGDDAISSGSISLYGLQRDIAQAGWGTSAIPLIGCNVTGLTVGGGSVPSAPITINPALPTPLITGQDPDTDTLLIVSGNGNGTVEGDQILSGSGTSYDVHTPSVFALNSFVVASPSEPIAGACGRKATTVTAVTATTVSVATAATFTVAPGDRLFELGANPIVRVYAIRGGNLTVCNWRVADCAAAANNDNADVWVPVANNIVSLRAQYGRDTAAGAMDGIFDVWDQDIATTGTPISTNPDKNLPGCARARIPAVRLAVVARSSQPERPAGGTAVTPAAPVWSGSDALAVTVNATNAAAVGIVPPSPDATWPTWHDFRYKVFETVVPLRNITSPGVLEQC